MARLTTIAIALALSVICFSQTPEMYQISTDQGLAHERVWCSLQDKLGYMWFGTSNGLCRYDGKELITFKKQDGLLGNSVVSILQTDSLDLLVTCHLRGVNRVKIGHQPHIEQVYSPVPLLASHLHDSLIVNIVSKNVQAYVCPEDSLILYQTNVNIHRSLIDSKGNLLYTTDEGLQSLDLSTGVTQNLIESNLNYFALAKDRKQQLWIGAQGRLISVNGNLESREYSRGLPAQSSANCISIAKQGIFASLVGDGLYCSKDEGQSFTKVVSDKGFLKSTINHIFEDRESNIWLSTWAEGVIVLPATVFSHYRVGTDLQYGAINRFHFDQHNKRMMVGALKDVFILSDQGPVPLGLDELSTGLVNPGEIGTSSSGKLMIGSFALNQGAAGFQVKKLERSDGPVFLNGLYSKITPFTKDGNSLLFTDGWTREAIQEIPIKIGTTTVKRGDWGKYRRLSTQWIHNQNDSCFWSSDANGPFRYDWIADTMYRVAQFDSTHFPTSLFRSTVYNYKEDQQGRIWMATDVGLHCYDGNWKSYETDDGLPDQTVKDIAFDSKGHLWLATTRGLTCFDHHNFFSFDKSHGLMQTQLSNVEIDRSIDKLYLQSTAGISTVMIEDLLNSLAEQPVFPFYLQSINIEGRTLDSLDNEITLTANESEVDFKLAACTYSSQKVQMQYRLDDAKWRKIENAQLNLSQLKYGQYNLEFRASNTGFQWTTLGPYNLQIQAPFYRKAWFLISVGLASLALLLMLLQRRFLALQRESEAKLLQDRRINYLEQRALSASMNPHFIFNALNSIQELIHQGDELKCDRYMALFARLIRGNLELSGQDQVLLEDELEIVRAYLQLQALRFGDEFTWTLRLSDDLDPEFLLLPSMIIQPFLENALEHGIRPKGSGHLELLIAEQEDVLLITINDDGIGMAASKEKRKRNPDHKSLGLPITEARIDLFGKLHQTDASVNFESSAAGTQVQITLPRVSPQSSDEGRL